MVLSCFFRDLRSSQSNFGDVCCRTPIWLCMTCGGFSWTILFYWFNLWYLLDIARPDRSNRSPLCCDPSICSRFLYIFHLTCHILLDTLMNFPPHTYKIFSLYVQSSSYLQFICRLVFSICHNLGLFLFVWSWRWYLVEI